MENDSIKEVLKTMEELKKLNIYKEEINNLNEELKSKKVEMEELSKKIKLHISGSPLKEIDEEKLRAAEREYKELERVKKNKQTDLNKKFESLKETALSKIEEEMKKFKRFKKLYDSIDAYENVAQNAENTVKKLIQDFNDGNNIDQSMLNTARQEVKTNREKAEEIEKEIKSDLEKGYIDLDLNIEQYADLEHLKIKIDSLNVEKLNENFEEEFLNKYSQLEKQEVVIEETEPKIIEAEVEPEQEETVELNDTTEQVVENQEEIDGREKVEKLLSLVSYRLDEYKKYIENKEQILAFKEKEDKESETKFYEEIRENAVKIKSYEKAIEDLAEEAKSYLTKTDKEKIIEFEKQEKEYVEKNKKLTAKYEEFNSKQKEQENNDSLVTSENTEPEIIESTNIEPTNEEIERKKEQIAKLKELIANGIDVNTNQMFLETAELELEEEIQKERQKGDTSKSTDNEQLSSTPTPTTKKTENVNNIEIISYKKDDKTYPDTYNKPMVKYVLDDKKRNEYYNFTDVKDEENKDEARKAEIVKILKNVYQDKDFDSDEGKQEIAKYKNADPNIVGILAKNEKRLEEYLALLNGEKEVNLEDKNTLKIEYDIKNISKSKITKEQKIELEDLAYRHRNIAVVKTNLLQKIKFAFRGFRERISNLNKVKALPGKGEEAPLKVETPDFKEQLKVKEDENVSDLSEKIQESIKNKKEADKIQSFVDEKVAEFNEEEDR